MPQYQGVWNLAQQAQALTRQQWVTDPLFDYTTLLLQGDNVSSSSQNNVFVDSSTNNFLITRNGNTTQGSFSPFSLQPGAWGTYYTGVANNNGTNVPANAAYSFGTGDFTVEAWVFVPPISNTNGKMIIDSRPTSTNGAYWNMGLSSTGQLIGATMTTGGTTLISPLPIPTNQWVHVAFTRGSGFLNLWVNGVSVASSSGNTNNISSDILKIGYNAFASVASDTWFEGYMSNLRVVKGVAVYTGPFTPPTEALQKTQSSGVNIAAITGSQTSLLIQQSNRFVDNSNTAATISTINTWPTIQAFSPFAPQYQYTPTVTGGSGYFDGTTDYLSGTITAINNTTMTMECWVYNTVFDNTNGNHYVQIDNGANTNYLLSHNGNGSVRFLSRNNTGGAIFDLTSATGVLKLNQWQHVVGVRNASAASLYVDGVRVATVSSPSVSSTDGTSLFIGTNAAGASPRYMNGYMASARIVSGTAVYDPTLSTLPVPTAPLTNISNTRLLLNFTNAGILDGTMKNNLETVGNAQVSTSVVKYGSGSMYFDGTDDRLLIPTVSQNQAMGTGNWTVEFWFYSTITTFSNWRIMLDFRPNTTNGAYITCSINASAQPIFYTQAAERIIGNAIVSNQWYHFAVCKANNVTRMFINGAQVGSTYADTNSYLDSGRILVGGGGYTLGTEMFLGYIDDLRITKGIARYTRNFTPPQVALPRQ